MKKLFTILFLLILNVFIIAQTATPPVGSGTSGDPYQIANLENLYWLTQTSSAWETGTYFIQTANIDASTSSSWANGQGLSPIGNSSSKFYGNYDGNGKTIDAIFINRTSSYYVGLFGYTSGAVINNLGITNADITSLGYSGCLIGNNNNGSTVSNCFATGTNTATSYGVCGLLVGQNSGTIECCYAKHGSVSGNGASWAVGGLVGVNYSGGVIRNSYSDCTVVCANQQGGGFVGRNGLNGAATIENCYSLGHTTGNTYSGGFCGSNTGGSITNCYNAGLFTYTGSSNSGGGFCGSNSATISQCFWDTQTSYATSQGGTGKTTAEMQTISTFTDAGWDCSSCWQIVGTNYPDLRGNTNSELPVELTTFSAIVYDNVVELNWETATEINNYGFEIESRHESDDWGKIDFISGYGNSNSPKLYQYAYKSNGFGKYSYRLKQIDIDGSFEYSNVIEVDLGLPKEFELSQNYPNPFNPSTNISFVIPQAGFVTLKVYDAIGNEVTVLVNETLQAGEHLSNFDAAELSSGIYFYQLRTADFTKVNKMLLIK